MAEEEAKLAARRAEVEARIAAARAVQDKRGGAICRTLTRDEIVEKLCAVPAFVLLNGDHNAVSIVDGVNGGETIYWHVDVAEAKAQLAAAKAQSPDVDGLHLGSSTLAQACKP